MSQSSFKTILIEDSIIADLTSQESFGILSGSAEKTMQRYLSTSASNNSLIFNIQIPSENIVVSRHVFIQSDIAFTVNIGTGAASVVSSGSLAFNLGVSEALQSFPLQSLFTNYSAMVNNTSITTNLQDILPQVGQMYDKRVLSSFNTTTPSMIDNTQGYFQDGIGTNSNVLANVNDLGYDADYVPRGAFNMTCVPARFLGGVYQDQSLVSTGAANETWQVYCFTTVAEPFLALAPFCDVGSDNASGLIGINTITLTANIDSTCKRLFSTANTSIVGGVLTSAISSIALGTASCPAGIAAQCPSVSPIGFTNTFLLMEFLSLQASQAARISSKCVIGIVDYPRYITPSSNTASIVSQGSATIISQNIQLNAVPDLFLICVRKQMATQTWADSASFLSISQVSINFNNKSGILASANQQQLYQLSAKNGAHQTFQEFSGKYNSSTTSGTGVLIPSIGSLLVLNPALDFGLDDFLSSSSLGQFNFTITVTCANQFGFTVAPELVVVCVNSGLFISESGVSSTYQGILTKADVLSAKSGPPEVDTQEYQRLVGGKLSNQGMSRLLKRYRKKEHKTSGGAFSGGLLSGGGGPCGAGGSHGKSKLSKHHK